MDQHSTEPGRPEPWTVSLSEGDALTLIGHLLSSAELCLYEPELYGTFRLLDAASRFIDLLLAGERAGDDRFLQHLKQEIDQQKTAMMFDPPAFRAFAREVPVLLAARLKEHARAMEGI